VESDGTEVEALRKAAEVLRNSDGTQVERRGMDVEVWRNRQGINLDILDQMPILLAPDGLHAVGVFLQTTTTMNIHIGKILNRSVDKYVVTGRTEWRGGAWRLEFLQPEGMSYKEWRALAKMKSGLYEESVIQAAFSE
jgi:hypothetical protein